MFCMIHFYGSTKQWRSIWSPSVTLLPSQIPSPLRPCSHLKYSSIPYFPNRSRFPPPPLPLFHSFAASPLPSQTQDPQFTPILLQWDQQGISITLLCFHSGSSSATTPERMPLSRYAAILSSNIPPSPSRSHPSNNPISVPLVFTAVIATQRRVPNSPSPDS